MLSSRVISPSLRRFSSYVSPYSLDKIYPSSSGTVSQPTPDPTVFNGTIPLDKLKVSTSTSSGPGGQHVNKVATRVELRFHVESADWIPEAIRTKLASHFVHRINNKGEMIVRSQRTRAQTLNMADALDKLREAIRECQNILEFENRGITDMDKVILDKRKEAFNERRLLEKRRTKEKRELKRNIEFD